MRKSNLLKSFLNDQLGTVAVMTGLAIVPLFIAAGAAIDFARFNAAQTPRSHRHAASW